MALEAAVYDELKAKLANSTIKVKVGDEEKSLFDYIVYTEDGVEKTRSANKDLTMQRETWEKTEKEYKKNIDELSSKSGKGKEEKEEWERQLNAVNDQLKSVKELYEAADKRAKENEEKAKQANAKASQEGLSTDLLKELAEHKIVGSQADVAITAILAKGYANIAADSETGLYKRSYMVSKDGKELAADIKTLCKWFADTNPFLVSASGKTGTGMNHDTSRPGGESGERNYLAMISKK